MLDLEQSKNERVANELVEQGAALAEARPNHHFAYFSTEENRAAFIALIEQQFSGIDAHMNLMLQGRERAVTFWHTDIPDSDSTTRITAMLSLAAESCAASMTVGRRRSFVSSR